MEALYGKAVVGRIELDSGGSELEVVCSGEDRARATARVENGITWTSRAAEEVFEEGDGLLRSVAEILVGGTGDNVRGKGKCRTLPTNGVGDKLVLAPRAVERPRDSMGGWLVPDDWRAVDFPARRRKSLAEFGEAINVAE